MQTRQRWKIIGAVVLAVVVAMVFFYAEVAQAPRQAAELDASLTDTVTLSIEGLYTDKQVSFASGETLLQVLQGLNTQDPAMRLVVKEYAGLGTLIDGMGDLRNGMGGKYWQYQVNGVMPQVGAGAYAVKNGEVVEWFFGTSQE
ncbi:DUF4430 domain-containing protein [Patescibacteria group bacterium]|nr:DUF4430 domain-containing protein [Patescibacteria group bacterium]